MPMMNLNKSTYLEVLPTELQLQILKRIPNVQVLRNLLHASPQYFRVYRTSRKTVLSHVAWSQITPAILPIALNALERRDHRKFRSNHTRLFEFQRSIREPHDVPFEIWEKLLQFHEIVESLISGFISSRLVALENSLYPETQSTLPSQKCPDTHLTLSQVEYTRLARAFYHLDLYGNLFHDLDTSRLQFRRIISAHTKRGTHFLESLQDWELEELLCVRSYMMERLKDFLNKLDDDFMEAFQKEMPLISWQLQEPPGSWGDAMPSLLCDQGYEWLQDPWIESCLTRGIEKLSTMFSTDKDTIQAKFRILGERDNLGKYMTSAIREMSSCTERELAAKMKKLPEIGYYDNIEQPNEAWFWAMKFSGHPRICIPRDFRKRWVTEAYDIHPLECWGYVIWDHDRLDRLGILSKRHVKESPM